ncbi:hypothetical protein D3C72_917360 [compost metagenome]
MHDAFNENEARAEHIGRPVQHGIPMVRLSRNQRFRVTGAVTKKIGRRKPEDILENRLGVVGDAIDGGIHMARYRHDHRVHHLLLGIPLIAKQFSQRVRRDGQRLLGGRAQRLAIEKDGKATLLHLSDGDILVEPLRQRFLHLDLRAQDRVGVAQALRKVVQEITHGTSSSVG